MVVNCHNWNVCLFNYFVASDANHNHLSSVLQDRLELLSRSHVTEVTQKTRLELENGQVSKEELDRSIQVRIVLPLKACLWGVFLVP